jgi:hypothetical protein
VVECADAAAGHACCQLLVSMHLSTACAAVALLYCLQCCSVPLSFLASTHLPCGQLYHCGLLLPILAPRRSGK